MTIQFRKWVAVLLIGALSIVLPIPAVHAAREATDAAPVIPHEAYSSGPNAGSAEGDPPGDGAGNGDGDPIDIETVIDQILDFIDLFDWR